MHRLANLHQALRRALNPRPPCTFPLADALLHEFDELTAAADAVRAAEGRALVAEYDRAQLEEQRQVLAEQQQSLADRLREAAAPAPVSSVVIDRDMTAALQAQIAAGNEERRQLRNELRRLERKLERRQPALAPAPAPGEPDDDGTETVAVHGGERGILLPEVSDAAARQLSTLPRPIAADTITVLGTLASGDAAAWTRVKQAKGMREPIWMVRVGIHYRMLLRQVGAKLVVIGVVSREGLMAAMKQLR